LRQLGFKVQVDARLAEMDFGRWDGRRWEDIPAEEIGAWADELLDHAPGGGETLRALARRAREFAAAAAAPTGMAATASAVSAVIAVTHGGWINALAHVDPARSRLPAADWPAPPRHGALVRLHLRLDGVAAVPCTRVAPDAPARPGADATLSSSSPSRS
jgi:alpha-ribazole phosphatase